MKYKAFRAGRSRSVNDWIHYIKTFALSALAILLAGAMETTWFSDMPFGLKGSPALLLLVTIMIGFWFGEQAGALCGLFAGLVADLSAGGVMISPLVYTLFGYFCGAGSKRFLAHNLPSFMIFSLFGILWKSAYTVLRILLEMKSIPPLVFFTNEMVPDALLTLLLSPLFYLAGWAYATRRSKR
jgi:rod shape-determining protein MreD